MFSSTYDYFKETFTFDSTLNKAIEHLTKVSNEARVLQYDQLTAMGELMLQRMEVINSVSLETMRVFKEGEYSFNDRTESVINSLAELHCYRVTEIRAALEVNNYKVAGIKGSVITPLLVGGVSGATAFGLACYAAKGMGLSGGAIINKALAILGLGSKASGGYGMTGGLIALGGLAVGMFALTYTAYSFAEWAQNTITYNKVMEETKEVNDLIGKLEIRGYGIRYARQMTPMVRMKFNSELSLLDGIEDKEEKLIAIESLANKVSELIKMDLDADNIKSQFEQFF